eukprot:XP_017946916.1 PREDICTED: uncharacterized protein LOC100493567 isoform X3 [Xenopus tropicalis]
MAATEGPGAREAMAMQSIEKRLSGWKCSKTALSEQDVADLLKEFTELNRKEQENGPDNVPQKHSDNPKCSLYPSPGNILHTGRQLPRTPGPGILPLLPSQRFEPKDPGNEFFEELYKSVTGNSIRCTDNMVPCGRQLQHTPVQTGKTDAIGNSSALSEKLPQECFGAGTLSQESNIEDQLRDLLTIKVPENQPSCKANNLFSGPQCSKPSLSDPVRNGKIVNCNNKTNASNVERGDSSVEVNRRISERPVQGLNKIRISGVLKKMHGYECRNEDLEFLEQLANLERIKVLKGELSGLRKELTATNRDMELVLAKKEKIEEDIQKMKKSFERTVQLGREFLCRTQEGTVVVKDLPPEGVLKHLKLMSIQHVHQQVKVQLLAAQKELTNTREKHKSLKTTVKGKTSLETESCEQQMKEAESRVQGLQARGRAIHNKEKKLLQLKTRLRKHREMLQKQRQVFRRREHKLAPCNRLLLQSQSAT